MSGDPVAPPAPKEIDETRSMELRHLSANAGLRGRRSVLVADDRQRVEDLVGLGTPVLRSVASKPEDHIERK
jgi:hypothetical protein